MNEDINFMNLYLILNSYIYSKIYLVYGIAFVFKNKEMKSIVCEYEDTRKIKNLSLSQFEEGINFRMKKDHIYNLKEYFYQINILFEKNILEMEEKEIPNILEKLRPIYPGKDEWVCLFEKKIEDTEILKNKIISLKKREKDLEEKIKLLEKKSTD